MSSKTWIEILITPLTVSIIGVAGSVYLGNKQDNTANLISNIQLAQAEQQFRQSHRLANANLQTQSIDIFFDALDSNDLNRIKLALKTLKYIPEDIRKEYTDYVKVNAKQIVEKSNVSSERQKQAQADLISSAEAAAQNPKAKINNSEGSNLRPSPLTQQELVVDK